MLYQLRTATGDGARGAARAGATASTARRTRAATGTGRAGHELADLRDIIYLEGLRLELRQPVAEPALRPHVTPPLTSQIVMGR